MAAARTLQDAGRPPGGTALLLVAASAAALATSMNSTSLAVALPRIAADLGAAPLELQAVVNAYTVAVTLFVLPMGAWADAAGPRAPLAVGWSCFGAGSLVCAAAPGVELLVAGRALAGLGAAALLPVSASALVRGRRTRERSALVALWTMAGILGAPVGVVAGAVALEAAGWWAVPLLNVPLVVVGLSLTLRTAPRARERTSTARARAPWWRPGAAGRMPHGTAVLYRCGTAGAALANVVVASTWFLLPQVAAAALSPSAWAAGAAVLAGVSGAVLGNGAAVVLRRVMADRSVLATGLLTTVVSLGWAAARPSPGSLAALCSWAGVQGFATGLLLVTSIDLALGAAAGTTRSAGWSAVLQTWRQAGSVSGVAMCGVVVTHVASRPASGAGADRAGRDVTGGPAAEVLAQATTVLAVACAVLGVLLLACTVRLLRPERGAVACDVARGRRRGDRDNAAHGCADPDHA